jgi:hypothetical protein
MADWFRKAGEIWGKADRATGGWLPGGGTPSPLTQYFQGRPDISKPERRTLEGDLANSLNAAASFVASTRPAVKQMIQKSPDFVQSGISTGLNQLPASANLFGRYYTGLGDKGLQFSKQYKNNLFGMVEDASKLTPYILEQLKGAETITKNATPGGAEFLSAKERNDQLAAIRSGLRRIKQGDVRFDSQAGADNDTDSFGGYGTSLGAAWFSRTPKGGYKTNETYDFIYADADKKYPVPYGPYPGGIQPQGPSETMTSQAAEILLGRKPNFVSGRGASSPESLFGRAIVAKMESDPFNYTLEVNRPQ